MPHAPQNVTEVFPCTALAEKIQDKTKKSAEDFAVKIGRAPALAVVLVGEDPASQVYVRKKTETCAKNSIDCNDYKLPKETTEAELSQLIEKLNADPNIDGVLVQSPLPKHIDERKIQSLISPQKDVDGFHPQNAGELFIDAKKCLNEGLPPCTPAGVMEIFKEKNISLSGKHAVVVGRSTIVGKPMALMLLAENATVTICHSKTKNLPEECRRADILISAIGSANFIRREHVKEGAVVIDIGINRIELDGKKRLVGDVLSAELKGHALFVTPVPNGIGPMTIAMLLRNTVRAALRNHKLPLAL